MAAWSADSPDVPVTRPVSEKAVLSWSGGYAGLGVGDAWSRNTADFALLPETFGTMGLPPTTELSSQGFIGGAQAGFNYQIGRVVFGPELDFYSLNQSARFTATGTDSFGYPYVTTRSESLDWLGTSRFRLGFTPADRILIYGTGGVAFGHMSGATNTSDPGIDVLGFSLLGLNNAGSFSETKVGSAWGAGVEYALGNHLSARVEYLNYDLGHITVSGTPRSAFGVSPNFSNTNFAEAGQMVRLGLNYRFDSSGRASPEPETYATSALLRDITAELGSRYWFSTGKTVNHLFNPAGSSMNSELTYGSLAAQPVELFARTEHVSGFFLKGNIGTGAVGSGNLKDEDFPPFTTPYSSTSSSQKDGAITYGTADLGYDFLRRSKYTLGAFAGYSYYHEALNADGCVQTASNRVTCVPTIPDSVQGITNDGAWQSARLGLNGEIRPIDRLKLSADVAWLPYTTLNSTDTHWLRINAPGGFTGPTPEDGTGHNGYQMESVLSYQITPAFSLGLGGRYWYMETSGKAHFEGDTVGGGGVAQPVKFSTNRYGVFAQAAFLF